MPLAASPVTQITRGRRARQAKRSATPSSSCARARPLVRCRARELCGAQEVDLGADQGAHRAQEGEQCVAAGVAAGGAVAAQQSAGEVVVAAGDVHDQEGEVVADVGDAQGAVELDAVDGLDVGAEQDVLRPQVTVAVADEARRARGGELGSEGGERRAAEASELRESPLGAPILRERGEGLIEHRGEPAGVDVGLDGSGGMKAGDRGTDRDQVGFGRAAVREARAQGRGLVIAIHHDRVLDGARVALGATARPSGPRGTSATTSR